MTEKNRLREDVTNSELFTHDHFFISMWSSILSPPIPFPLCSPNSLWFKPLPFTSSPPPASSALPRWYLRAVEQEAGEQTAGEATLMLSCAICRGHVAERQNRLQQHHHTWQTHQSRPKGEHEEDEENPTCKQSDEQTRPFPLLDGFHQFKKKKTRTKRKTFLNGDIYHLASFLFSPKRIVSLTNKTKI